MPAQRAQRARPRWPPFRHAFAVGIGHGDQLSRRQLYQAMDHHPGNGLCADLQRVAVIL